MLATPRSTALPETTFRSMTLDSAATSLAPSCCKTGRHRRLAGLLVVAVVIMVLAYWIEPRDAISGRSPAVGLPMPSLKLVSLTAQVSRDTLVGLRSRPSEARVLTGSSFAERVTLIHFWGTWCGPCRRELPDLAKLHQHFSSEPAFQFFSVSCESYDDPSLETLVHRTAQYYKTEKIDLPTFADLSTNARREILCLMERDAMAYPTTVLVDQEGIIHATWVGIPPGGVGTIATHVQNLLNDQLALE